MSTEDIPLVRRARVTNIDIEFEGIEPTAGKGATVRRADPWQVEPQKLRDVFRAALDAFQYGHEVDVFTDRFGRIVRVQRVRATA